MEKNLLNCNGKTFRYNKNYTAAFDKADGQLIAHCFHRYKLIQLLCEEDDVQINEDYCNRFYDIFNMSQLKKDTCKLDQCIKHDSQFNLFFIPSQ